MECSTIPAKIIATCFALVAFAAAVAVGLAAGNPTSTILGRALLAMFVCWVVGRIVGGVAIRTVQNDIDTYKASHPIPTEPIEQGDQPDATQNQDTFEPKERAA